MIEYKDYEYDNYRLHLIHTNYSKTINVSFYFGNKYSLYDKIYSLFLSEILLISNKEYNSIKKLKMALIDLYNMKVFNNSKRIGNYLLTSLGFDIINPKFINCNYFSDSLKLFIDLLFNPNVNNEMFDEVSFNIIKKSLIADIDTIVENKNEYCDLLCFNTLSTDAPYYEDLNETRSIINDITPSSLYEYYKSFYKNSILDIYVCGDINDDFIRDFNVNIDSLNKKYDDVVYVDYNDYEYKNNSLDSDVSQNIFNVLLTYKDISEFEYKYVSNIFNNIFGGSVDSLLFNSVRGDNSLCYYIYSDLRKCDSVISVNTGITCESKRVLDIIKDCLDKIIKGDFSDELLNNSINNYVNALDLRGESLRFLVFFSINNLVSGNDSIIERINNVKNVTKKDVMDFASKLKISSSFLLGRE